jgi:hypothetical protein
LWISGLEIIKRNLGITRVLELSATPFFLRGSGYAEGTLFPWTMSDFSLMDAIECGLVKLPRVPVADNIPGGDMPKFRNLWEHIRAKMPKKGRGKSDALDPLSIPVELQTALEALLRVMEQSQNQGSTLFHRCLQQYVNVQISLRLHLGLSANQRRWFDDARKRTSQTIPEF